MKKATDNQSQKNKDWDTNLSRVSFHISLTLVVFTTVTFFLAWLGSYLVYVLGFTSKVSSIPRLWVLGSLGVYVFIGILICQILADKYLESRFSDFKTKASSFLLTIFSIILASLIFIGLVYFSAYFMTFLKIKYWL